MEETLAIKALLSEDVVPKMAANRSVWGHRSSTKCCGWASASFRQQERRRSCRWGRSEATHQSRKASGDEGDGVEHQTCLGPLELAPLLAKGVRRQGGVTPKLEGWLAVRATKCDERLGQHMAMEPWLAQRDPHSAPSLHAAPSQHSHTLRALRFRPNGCEAESTGRRPRCSMRPRWLPR